MRCVRYGWALAAVVLLVPCTGTQPLGATHATGSQLDGQKREVIFAIQRSHRLHVFDADTLEPLGQIVGLNNLLEHVSVSPNGQTLFLAQAATVDGNGCCALFAFNLMTREMCHMLEPVMDSVLSPDGQWVFAQRGSVGIDVFDTRTLVRTTIATFDVRRAHENRDRLPLRGQYALYPSSDGRWMFGITLWQKPSLGIFDLWTQTMVRELTIPVATGAWVGNQFYLYENNDEQPRLFAVNPEMTSLGPPRPITNSTPVLTPAQLPAHAQLITTGDRLLVYQAAAWWLHNSIDEVRSPGIFVIDPTIGGLIAHLTPSVEFAQVTVGTEGQRLYGLDAGQPPYQRNGQGPRLLALDARTGVVLAEQSLTPDVWHLAVARVPASLVPRGEVQPTACRAPR